MKPSHPSALSLTCMYRKKKSAGVVIIDGTFVVAMQKKAHVLYFHCNHLKLWPCQKGPVCVCFALVSPDKNSTLKEDTFFSIWVHLHRSWLLLDLANSRSPWVDFFFLCVCVCCIYPHYLFTPLEEPGIVGGLLRQELWFEHADFFRCVCSVKLQWHLIIRFHMCCPWKYTQCGLNVEVFCWAFYIWIVLIISRLYVKRYSESYSMKISSGGRGAAPNCKVDKVRQWEMLRSP